MGVLLKMLYKSFLLNIISQWPAKATVKVVEGHL